MAVPIRPVPAIPILKRFSRRARDDYQEMQETI